MTLTALSHDALEETRRRLQPYLHRTPVLTCSALDERAGRRVFLKCENFQRTGSFKLRGALSALLQLPPDELARGVVTHSSGNHAQAVALAARLLGTRAWIVLPRTAPEIKRRAVAGYGAEITVCEPTMAAREEATQALIDATGAHLIHPYDDDRVIAGQATAALELLEDHPDLDVLLAPISGGGLLAGTALAASRRTPSPRVVGCEPALADDAYQSLKAGVIVRQPAGPTMADGLRANFCERTFAIVRALVEGIVLVTEEEMVEAMRFVWERMKIVIEPSSAAAVAPLLFRPEVVGGRRLGVILSGGNVEFPLSASGQPPARRPEGARPVSRR